MTKVAIILVNWNSKQDTITCIHSLNILNYSYGKVTIYLIDNASTDASAVEIHKKFPEVKIIQNKDNYGFARGVNQGITTAISEGYDYLWILNNDTNVHKNALSLIHAFDDPSVGVAGSKVYFTKGHEFHKNIYKNDQIGKVLWYAGGYIDWNNMYASHRGVDEVDVHQYDVISETDFVTGCSMMIRSGIIKELGLFDESYYLYFEDVDYCLRVQKNGYKTVYYPDSIVWHNNAGSSGGSGSSIHEYYQTRNRFKFGMKYAPYRTRFALLRESINFLLQDNNIKKQAIADSLFGKYGKKKDI